MPYYVSTVCKTTVNWQPVQPPVTLGPFETIEGAVTAAQAYQDNAFRAQCSVECSIFGDGVVNPIEAWARAVSRRAA
jgi:hypothetical protein